MAGFIFDMDGMLLDSIPVWHQAERRVLEEVGIELPKEKRDELNALTLEEAGAWFHEEFGILGDGAEVAEAIIGHMLVYYQSTIEANPGVMEFVQAVYEAGAPMCVLSSSPRAFIEAGLGHTGLKRFFRDDLVISAEDSGLKKRAPETFDRICVLLGTEPGDTWLFDDSWYALATAHEAGLRCVGTFSADGCGTHEELARYAEIVVDDLTGLDPADFL